jgi:small subunit ribosomal protein S20
LENLRYKSSIKTYFRRLRETLTAGDGDAVEDAAKRLTATIDKAAAHRAIHKNTAARKKSRVARLLARR